MENHYGIAVKNKYDLFLDDDCDPFEILKSQEEEKLKSKTDKTKKDAKNEKAKSGKTKVLKTTATPVAVQPKGVDLNANKKEDQKPRGRGKPTEGGERTGSARPFRESGNRELDRPPRRERQDKERTDRPPAEFRDRTDRPESGRGRGRGERGVRGRGGPRGAGAGGGRGGFDRFGKREFERHSGSDKTGVKPVDKREGGGAHNWGTIKDDMEKEKQSGEPLNESVNDETTESPDTENQNPNAEPEEETPAEEEEAKEMTLDEWRAQQLQERKQAQFNIRKPNEGADGGQWKKTFVLQKKPVEHESEEESDDEADEDHRQKKNLLNIEITFNDQPQRGRGGRRGRGGGGRGRGEGERERGGERGERGGGRGGRGDRGDGGGRGFGPRGDRPTRPERGSREAAAPHIEDENDFPSLGAK